MTSVVAAIAILVVSWNPALVAERPPALDARRWIGMAIAAVLSLAIAVASDSILAALDVSAPTFRTAAGAVIATTGARWLVGPAPQPDEGRPAALGFIDVGTPALVFAVIATTVASGWWWTFAGIVIAAGATGGLQRAAIPPALVGWARRMFAGGAVGLGVALIYAGIRSV
jgi:hypothetical protein